MAGSIADLIRSLAGHNLGLLMRKMIGAGTPKEAAARGPLLFIVICSEERLPYSPSQALAAKESSAFSSSPSVLTLRDQNGHIVNGLSGPTSNRRRCGRPFRPIRSSTPSTPILNSSPSRHSLRNQ